MAYLASGAQKAYLKRLCNEAFSRRIETGINSSHIDAFTAKYASEAIDRVKALLQSN